MTANEIADGLAQMHIEKDVNGLFNKRIQNMLRQQQAEIEALKAGKIRAYDNGVEDGRKPNTNPVKELTDFEIKGVLALDECWIGEDSSMPNMIAFARAILRKAQEKC